MRRIVLAVLFFALAAPATAAAPHVTIAQGKLSGATEDGTAVFKGIPFAAPPVGDLRWRPPQQAPHWRGVRDATQFGAVCPQSTGMVGPLKQSEDCLTVNVWTPKTDAGAKLPVMVWIYGGAFVVGGSALPFYDGAALANHGVVIVSFNYRLGWLGFFDHRALAGENAGDATGNYGLMDQIAALKWVRANIARFGGDPKNVTIFGESAGGISVNDLMASHEARGLFEKAISESGLGLQPLYAKAQSEDIAEKFAARHGITGDDAAALSKLRKLSVKTILADQRTVRDPSAIGPMVDGKVLSEQTSAAFANGDIADAAYIAGSNSDEASLIKEIPLSLEFLEKPLGDNAKKIRAFYETDGPISDQQFRTLLFDDELFAAGAHGLAGFAAAHGRPAYVYHFAYIPEPSRETLKGVPHGGEIPFVFGMKGFAEFPPTKHMVAQATDKDRGIVAMMQAYWTNFAKTGNPNGGGLPNWPRFNPKAPQTLVVNDDTKAVSDFRHGALSLIFQSFRKLAQQAAAGPATQESR